MNQEWFEMADVRRKKLDDAVWIPLRSNNSTTLGEHGYVGYRSEIFAVGSLAVAVRARRDAEALGWTDLGPAHSHKGGFCHDRYVPADVFEDSRIGQAVPLALEQRGNREEPEVWHLHQDLMITLGLKREDNLWLAMDEGYVEVARLYIGTSGQPRLLEVRAEHLKDYLCARGMALYISSYRLREEILEDHSHIGWPKNVLSCDFDGVGHWGGRMLEIHEGGAPFGSSARVLQLSRTNVDFTEDVPKIELSDEGVVSKSWTKTYQGRKLHLVRGELWRNEWVEPAERSPRVRRDKLPPSIFFITNAEGAQESRETLCAGRRWLWFRPDVIMALAQRRGGALQWHTRDTGQVRCSPDSGVHFGMNRLGLVNVYAKDIALLPEWQQRLWVGFNVGPEGGVSEELLASQAEGIPADTAAPEELLPKVIVLLNEVGMERLGFRPLREHEQLGTIISRTHRFRSVDSNGFFSLAKDLARLTADSFDGAALQGVAVSPKGEKRSSLKALENLLARGIDPPAARALLGPLHGVYNLRHTDAHLPGSDLEEALRLAGVDQTSPFVLQGYQLLHSCVSSLYAIAEALNQLNV